ALLTVSVTGCAPLAINAPLAGDTRPGVVTVAVPVASTGDFAHAATPAARANTIPRYLVVIQSPCWPSAKPNDDLSTKNRNQLKNIDGLRFVPRQDDGARVERQPRITTPLAQLGAQPLQRAAFGAAGLELLDPIDDRDFQIGHAAPRLERQ